jgi:hypothetical protein
VSSLRARANHALYLARIQISAWQDQCGHEQVPVTTLAQAFLPAAGSHLRTAYGYFLLTLVGATQIESSLPSTVADLPEIPHGIMRPPEVAEFQILEREGWLADMLAAVDLDIKIRSPGIAAAQTLSLMPAASASPAQALAWCDAMQNLFDRMSDSLDEY